MNGLQVSALVCAALGSSDISPKAQDLVFDSPAALGAIHTDKVTEASGVVASLTTPGVFWTHNDGPTDHVYAFRTDGALLGDFDFSKSPNDVEDIAIGPGPDPSLHYLYVGDIGSNSADRDDVHIYRFPEPVVDVNRAADPVSHTIKSGVENFQLRYPSGKYNSEAMLVDPVDRMVYIVTKEKDEAHVFGISIDQLADDKSRDLEFVCSIPFAHANGGAVSIDGQIIALRREDFACAWIRNRGEAIGDALMRPATQIPIVGPPTEPNGEAISFLPDNSGYITLSEGLNERVYLFRRTVSGGCSDRPRFSDVPHVSNEGLILTFAACAGSTIVLERTTDFRNWQQIARIAVTSGPGSYTDSQLSGTSLYRLRAQ